MMARVRYIVFLVGSIGHYFLQSSLLESNICSHNHCSSKDILIDLIKVLRAMTLTMNNLNDLKWNKDVIFPVLSYLY